MELDIVILDSGIQRGEHPVSTLLSPQSLLKYQASPPLLATSTKKRELSMPSFISQECLQSIKHTFA